jgi:cyclophilin family peptidyl-prolyl cis-trans isomerase
MWLRLTLALLTCLPAYQSSGPSGLQAPGAARRSQGGIAKAYRPAPGEVDLYGSISGKGQFIIRLHTHEAPRTTAHVITLAKSGFYDGQRFFRVITQPRPYLVQIGDPASRTLPMDSNQLGQGGSGVSVRFEASGFSHDEGAVALATAGGDRNSGDSQFYITLGDFSHLLDGTDTVFGKVVQGLDVIHHIELGDTLLNLRVVNG